MLNKKSEFFRASSICPILKMDQRSYPFGMGVDLFPELWHGEKKGKKESKKTLLWKIPEKGEALQQMSVIDKKEV
jgi:hypothetical protein